MTALLVELAEGLPMHDVSEFIVAHGQDIPNFCRAMFQTVDKFGNTRKIEGHVTEVHKRLAFANEISKYHDASIFGEFGALIPRHSRVAEGYGREYHRPCHLYGYRGILPLYGTCRKMEMAPVESNQDIVMNAPEYTSSSSSGKARQAQKLQGRKEWQKCRPQERLHELSRGTRERV